MKKALIVGATGFGGLGLIEILLRHPGIRIKQLVARKDAGVPVSKVFPHLKGYCDMLVEAPENIDYNEVDIAFFFHTGQGGNDAHKGVPPPQNSGHRLQRGLSVRQRKRLRSVRGEQGMETAHLAAEALPEAVYGLPEINANKIKHARIVGNPGCFAVSMILGLLPAVEKGLIEGASIVCDGKTGVSGAGKNPGESNFYPQRYENVNTYREGRHQHIVEVDNVLIARGGGQHRILFVPQIVPLNRGILTTIYADCARGLSTADVQATYREYYKGKPFVFITDSSPNTTDVRGSNRCEVRTMVDERTGKLFITSVIDNLIKGQSGNAVQNANLMLGFEETAGLAVLPFYP